MLENEARARGMNGRMNDRLERCEIVGVTKNLPGKFLAIQTAIARRTPEPRPDRLDQLRSSSACRRRTTASASNKGIPARSNICATVDFPMPIDPVSARRITRTT